jgi:hypothetical protein
MIFLIGPKTYCEGSAVAIVRGMEQNALDYPHRGESIHQFLLWSLNQVSDYIPMRELGVSQQTDEETLALSFLCLLDEYGLGKLRLATGRDEGH